MKEIMKTKLWTPEQPLRELERGIAAYFVDHAKFLSQELKNNRLKVILIPAPDPKHYGHKIRAVENTNPEWYRELYQHHKHFRRDRSLNSLQRIRIKKDYAAIYSSYDFRYRSLILERLVKGFMYEGSFVEAIERVKSYF